MEIEWGMPKSKAPFIRFHNLTSPLDNGCWIWNGSFTNAGYGQFKAFGKMVAAHRFAYELYKGPIPNGMNILHSCDDKRCVNPDHLRFGTHLQNMQEAAQRGRIVSGDRHPMFGRKNPRPNQANKVIVLGREFESQKSAEREFGLGSGTVRYWIKHHPHKAKLIQKGRKC